MFVSWLVLLWLMPKQEFYYKLEKTLEKNDIKINEERIEEGIFSLTIYNADIYVKGIKLATIDKISFFTLLFYSKVDVENLVLDDTLKKVAPTQIKELVASHFVLSPFFLNLDVKNESFYAEGKTNLKEKSLRLDFNSTQGLEVLKPKLQQDEKGWYYEASF